jgi:hypothetical protein
MGVSPPILSGNHCVCLVTSGLADCATRYYKTNERVRSRLRQNQGFFTCYEGIIENMIFCEV